MASPKVPHPDVWLDALRSFRSRADDLAARVAADRLAREWAEDFARALARLHADAWRWGRLANGEGGESADESDLLVGRARLDAEARFVQRFAAQIGAGLGSEDEDGGAARIAARSRSYAGAARGTATEAFFSLAPEDERFRWVLGAVERHCSECPDLASRGLWRADELFVWPGSNDTPCLFNCQCRLVRASDGLSSLPPFA